MQRLPFCKKWLVGLPVVVPGIDLGAVRKDADAVFAAVGVRADLVGVALLRAPDRGRVRDAGIAAARSTGPRDIDDLDGGSPLLDGDGVRLDITEEARDRKE